MMHLTEKPVESAARAVEYSSRKGERVLGLFGGSGSTLWLARRPAEFEEARRRVLAILIAALEKRPEA